MAIQQHQAAHNVSLAPTDLSVLVAEGLLYSDSELTDRWGNRLIAIPRDNDDVEVITVGPDGTRGTADDLSSAFGSTCPGWPAPRSNRALAPLLLGSTFIGVVLLMAWLCLRRKPCVPGTKVSAS